MRSGILLIDALLVAAGRAVTAAYERDLRADE